MKKVIVFTVIISTIILGGAVAQQSINLGSDTQVQSEQASHRDTESAAASLVIEERKYQRGAFDISFPYFQGLQNKAAQEKINQDMAIMVENFLSDNNNEFTTEAIVRYEVHSLSPRLISFTVTSYTYTGGAHGLSFREGYTYDLNTGHRYEFKDLFRFDSNARANINEKITAQIQERNIPTFGPFQGVDDSPHFYIADNGQPVIFFQQYEIGPYAVGILEFLVMTEKVPV